MRFSERVCDDTHALGPRFPSYEICADESETSIVVGIEKTDDYPYEKRNKSDRYRKVERGENRLAARRDRSRR